MSWFDKESRFLCFLNLVYLQSKCFIVRDVKSQPKNGSCPGLEDCFWPDNDRIPSVLVLHVKLQQKAEKYCLKLKFHTATGSYLFLIKSVSSRNQTWFTRMISECIALLSIAKITIFQIPIIILSQYSQVFGFFPLLPFTTSPSFLV